MIRFTRFLLILSLLALPLFAEDAAKEITIPADKVKDLQIAKLELTNAALIQENLQIQFDAIKASNEEWKKATTAVKAAQDKGKEVFESTCKELKVDCTKYELAADSKRLVLKPATVAAK